jgi:hypothetical protein
MIEPAIAVRRESPIRLGLRAPLFLFRRRRRPPAAGRKAMRIVRILAVATGSGAAVESRET